MRIVKNWEWTDYRRMKVPNPYELSPNHYPTTVDIGIGGGEYEPWYITGDEATMILDMSSCSISFKLNGKELGVAYDNLKKEKILDIKCLCIFMLVL